AREFLRRRFEACYPFHPATLSVFQRKWQTLSQYQQTRGTLAMLAQWVSWAYREGFQRARNEPLITLGSAPLDAAEFRATILGQLGEPRLKDAIETDIAGANSHARALDADSKGALKEIHRRVGAAILFESSGGMVDKAAHLPELRFALGEPGIDTTSIDTAANAMERKGFYLRKVGSDGFRFGSKPTLKKVVWDRKASLDEEDVKREAREAVRREFERGAAVPIVLFPEDSTSVPDTPKLTLVVLEPETVLDAEVESNLASWTRKHGNTPRLHPASIVWCVKKVGRDLREKTETSLAWKRVSAEIGEGLLGTEFKPAEREDVRRNATMAEEAVKDEVWASYRYTLLYDPAHPDGLRQIDLGAGHASGSSTLAGRVLAALKNEGLLNETVGAGYLDRNWPTALKETGIWPLQGLRQAFMNGSLTRLADPERVLQEQIPKFVERGEFGLGSGQRPDGMFERHWFKEVVPQEEIVFDTQTFLLRKQKAEALRAQTAAEHAPAGTDAGTVTPEASVAAGWTSGTEAAEAGVPSEVAAMVRLCVRGEIPPEVWNRLGTKLLPKLRQGQSLRLSLTAEVEVALVDRARLEQEIRRILQEMGLWGWMVDGKDD
ncbi:MAG: DUF499 domain-containing protein, partial [Thermoplasmatota archaeon]